MGPFDNREIAIAIWAAVLLLWALFAMRRSPVWGNLLKAFVRKKILTALALMAVYIGIMVFCLWGAGLWGISQFNNTVLWSLFGATVSLFRVNSIADDRRYYRNAIRDILSFIVIVEFVVGYYTFDLWAELLIVPATAIFAAMLAVAEQKKEHAKTAQLLSGLMALFGLALIANAIYRLVVDFQSFATVQTLSDFLLSPVLSLLFLPFVFVLALYVNYEIAFLRVRYALKNPALEGYARRQALLGFHIRTGLLKRWTRNLNLARPENRKEIDASIREVKVLYAWERNPPEVPLESGWSPYLACQFLASEGLKPGDYHKGYGDEGEWWASSPYLEIGDAAVLRNNIAYYVEGGGFAAATLKLVLNVNEPKTVQEARSKLLEAIGVLHEKALGSSLTSELWQRISSEQPFAQEADGKKLSFVKEIWPQHSFGGYELRFSIEVR